MFQSVRLLRKQIKYLDKEAVAIARAQLWQTGSFSKLVNNNDHCMHTTMWALLSELDGNSLLEEKLEEQRMALKAFLYSWPALARVKWSTAIHCSLSRSNDSIKCCSSHWQEALCCYCMALYWKWRNPIGQLWMWQNESSLVQLASQQ